MPTLEELLLAACERGITHLTLYPVPSRDGKTTYWEARATPSTVHKYVNVTDTDPVVALKGVLLGLPKAPKRSPKELTAAVTPDAAPTLEPQQENIDQWLPNPNPT